LGTNYSKERFAKLLQTSDSNTAERHGYYSQEWNNIVQLYSKRQISVESDKLTVLSGIAKVFQNLSGWRYLAGLWWEDIFTELMSYCEGYKYVQRPKKYRAPSWSWAAIDSNVTFARSHLITDQETGYTVTYWAVQDLHLKPLEAHCKGNPDYETGAVLEGYLKVSGLLAEAIYRVVEPSRARPSPCACE
jgi:hypothetical protein